MQLHHTAELRASVAMAARGVFADNSGNLFSKSFELATKREDTGINIGHLPLTSNQSTRDQYRKVCLMWEDRVLSATAGNVLCQPVSLFFRRPVENMEPAITLKVQEYVTCGTPFDEGSVFDVAQRRKPVKVCDRIGLADSWRSWAIPAFPDPYMYDTFAEFEGACEGWHRVAGGSVDSRCEGGMSHLEGVLQKQPQREVFSFPERKEDACAKADVIKVSERLEQYRKLSFSGVDCRMGDLHRAYSMLVRSGFQTHMRRVDDNVHVYQMYGCGDESVGLKVPSLDGAPKKGSLDKVLGLPFRSIEDERSLFVDLCQRVRERDFRFASRLENLYRTVTVFHAFLKRRKYHPILNPRCDVLAKIKDAPVFVQAYQLFFRVYLFRVLVQLTAQLKVLQPQLVDMANSEREVLRFFLMANSKPIVDTIKAREMDSAFLPLYVSLMLVSVQVKSDEAVKFTEQAFFPCFNFIARMSRASNKKPLFKMIWNILSTKKIMLAMLEDMSKAVTSIGNVFYNPYNRLLVEYVRMLLMVSEKWLPTSMSKSPSWTIFLFNAVIPANHSQVGCLDFEVGRVAKRMMHLMVKSWFLNPVDSGWPQIVNNVQNLLLGLMQKLAHNPPSCYTVVQAFMKTISCSESLHVFGKQHADLSPLSAMLSSPFPQMRLAAWMIPSRIFRQQLEQALQLTTEQRFCNFLFPLLQDPRLRVDSIQFITYVIGLTKNEQQPTKSVVIHLNKKKVDAVSIFLKFVVKSGYSFYWYYNKPDCDQARIDFTSQMKRIRRAMMDPYIDHHIRSILDNDTKALIHENERQNRQRRRSRP